jgi:hypothetical protein
MSGATGLDVVSWFQGRVTFICKPGQRVIAEGVQNARPGMHQAEVSKL